MKTIKYKGYTITIQVKKTNSNYNHFVNISEPKAKLPFLGTAAKTEIEAIAWAKNKVYSFAAYYIANNILIANENKDEIKLATEFLKVYAKQELLIGNDDNPFNPLVAKTILLEEEFMKSIGATQD